MQVEVYADIACPWCRIGKAQFHRAVAEVGAEHEVELVHRPFQLAPDAAEEPRPLLDLMTEMFGAEQLDAIVAEVTRRGAGEGVPFHFDRAVTVNTLTAHRLAWLALRDYGSRVQERLITALFDAYFRDGANIADHAELAAVAERAGMDGDRARNLLAAGEGDAEVRGEVSAARGAGVSTVPTFVFGNGESMSGVTSTEEIRDALRRAEG